MRSKSFKTLEVEEIGRKNGRELRGFPILWMGIIENVFQIEGKKCKDQETLKCVGRKSMSVRGWCFSME